MIPKHTDQTDPRWKPRFFDFTLNDLVGDNDMLTFLIDVRGIPNDRVKVELHLEFNFLVDQRAGLPRTALVGFYQPDQFEPPAVPYAPTLEELQTFSWFANEVQRDRDEEQEYVPGVLPHGGASGSAQGDAPGGAPGGAQVKPEPSEETVHFSGLLSPGNSDGEVESRPKRVKMEPPR
ncbi:MAG: hypothetical protein M1833_006197 [Piccolia ochrophora]|nr:MAG: hypothetical protein M1833_006197 [Piccolia ochrophora]